jgi:hypothetical protein
MIWSCGAAIYPHDGGGWFIGYLDTANTITVVDPGAVEIGEQTTG